MSKIPYMKDEKLILLHARIKPIMIIDGQEHFIKNVPCISKCSFAVNSEPATLVNYLRPFCIIQTYHKYCEQFNNSRPSSAEVLAQIPEEHLERCKGYLMVDTEPFGGEIDWEKRRLKMLGEDY